METSQIDLNRFKNGDITEQRSYNNKKKKKNQMFKCIEGQEMINRSYLKTKMAASLPNIVETHLKIMSGH